MLNLFAKMFDLFLISLMGADRFGFGGFLIVNSCFC